MAFLELIFGFALIISIVGMFFDYRKQQLKIMSKMNQMEEGDLQKELAAIRQRLIVLERIVTDKNYTLQDEINNLRDK
jgi:hypothetical protein